MANANTINTYSPSDVKLVISGYTLTGWDKITIARSSQVFRPIRGIRGKHARAETLDSSANLAISLVQTSLSNLVLSSILEADSSNGTARLDLLLKDNSGNSRFQSSEAYIVGYPETSFSGGFEYRTWRFFCQTTTDFVVGDNVRPSTGVFDSIVNGISRTTSSIIDTASSIFK
jgi:hypothetical protein